MSVNQVQGRRSKTTERMEQTDLASKQAMSAEKAAVQKKMERLRNLRLSREAETPVAAEVIEQKPTKAPAKRNPYWK